jgi:thiol-disulfide isomerase/thioredoxin
LNLDRDRSKTLNEKFDLDGIPSLVAFSPSCETITSKGVHEIHVAPNKAFHQWLKGRSVFWSREARDSEYVWKSIPCSECYMNPLIGSRHGCKNRECHTDLCKTCLTKSKYEHPLVEYLLPKQHYSLEQLFKLVPHLLNPNNQEKIETKTLWEDGVKSIGIYFSAHWCSPCRSFTPKLAEIYKEVQESSQSFRLFFVSCDEDEKSFDEYRSTMPWLALALNSGAILDAYFQVSSKEYFSL